MFEFYYIIFYDYQNILYEKTYDLKKDYDNRLIIESTKFNQGDKNHGTSKNKRLHLHKR